MRLDNKVTKDELNKLEKFIKKIDFQNKIFKETNKILQKNKEKNK